MIKDAPHMITIRQQVFAMSPLFGMHVMKVLYHKHTHILWEVIELFNTVFNLTENTANATRKN